MGLNLKNILKYIISFFYYNLYKKYKSQKGNRVILYHAIGTDLDFDSYGISISKKKFTEHITYLKDNYEIIPLNENYKNNLNKLTVSITFDDGFKDNLYALELCERYNIPFTIYITTGFIGKSNYLDEEDIIKFSKSKNCTLGVHTVTHTPLDSLDYKMQYNELKNSKDYLENLIGRKVNQMSYPHGRYDDNTLSIIEKLGYNIVTSSHIGLNTTSNVNFRKLKRIEIIGSDGLMNLKKKILGYYDFL